MTTLSTTKQARQWIDEIRACHRDAGPEAMAILNAASVLEEALDAAGEADTKTIAEYLVDRPLSRWMDCHNGGDAMQTIRPIAQHVFHGQPL